ncbi:ABC transporter permease [Nostocoides sp. F2B08]|nr:ABC transporter permease [Tetrasphaera sp. F2B08]
MRREILVKITDKGFVLGTLFTVAILAAWLGWNAYQAERTSEYAVVTTAADAPMAEALAASATEIDDKVVVTSEVVADEAAAEAAVRDEEVDGWLHREGDGWTLTTVSGEGDLLGVTEQVVRAVTIDEQAQALGTTASELEAGSVVSSEFLVGDAERAGLAQAVGFVMAFLFYLSALVFGMQIASSVVEEKQSRIVEIIATSIPVRHLLAGKVLGNTVLAILQILLYAGVGLIGLSFTPYGSFVSAISGPVAWFLVFFAAGFVALACLWAVAGALASRTEDLQSTTTPLTFLVMGVFFSSFLLDGTAKVVASFIPPISGVLMPIRILEGDVPVWQPIVALAVMLVFALGTIIVGERLYRRSLLQNQGRISLKQAWTTAE